MDKWEKVVLFHRLLKKSRYCVAKNAVLDELECSEATFHRIRAYMQESLGAPVIYDKKYKGYRYDQANGTPFELPGLWFTKKELESLLCLDQAVEGLQGSFFSGMFEPMRNRFNPLFRAQKIRPEVLRDRIRILSIGSRESDPAVFKTMAEAVLHNKRVIIEHDSLTGTGPIKRDVSPQALVRYKDNWYLDAFCHLRNELRTFALNRINRAERTPGKFKSIPVGQREAFYAGAYGIFTGPAVKKAVIIFSGFAAREVSRETWHPRQESRRLSDGKYQLTIPYGHSRELIMDILRWGEDAEVVKPKELRREIRGIIEKMGEKYNK